MWPTGCQNPLINYHLTVNPIVLRWPLCGGHDVKIQWQTTNCKSHCPEVTVCSGQDVNIQLLTNCESYGQGSSDVFSSSESIV